MKGQEVTAECTICHRSFTYFRTIGPLRVTCSDECKRVRTLRANRENTLRKQGMSQSEVQDMMRHWHPRKSVKVKVGADHPKGRRCIWKHETEKGAEIHCVTVLCRYNPGPYCFVHAKRIEEQVMADMHRRLVRERELMMSSGSSTVPEQLQPFSVLRASLREAM